MANYRIVVGYDGSDGGLRALEWAVAEAARRDGTVQAVSAWQWTQPDLGVDIRAEHDRATREALEAAVAAVRVQYPTVAVSTEATPGVAADVLTRAAADADILVLGSHGHGRLFHAVLGSVAQECVRRATCPVVVVPVPRTAAQPVEPQPVEPQPPVSTAVY